MPQTPLTEHFAELVPWTMTAIGSLVALLFVVWNKSQEKDIKAQNKDISTLGDAIRAQAKAAEEAEVRRIAAHEAQEKRFDEREKAIRHEQGAAHGVAIARMEQLEKWRIEDMQSVLKCQKEHAANQVRRDDLLRIESVLASTVRHDDLLRLENQLAALEKEFIGLKDSVIEFHARFPKAKAGDE